MPYRLVVSIIFLGTTNFTIFRSFRSFRNFRSIWLCLSDLLFYPFFWGQRILLFFAVFAVFGYASQTCCFTHFSGDNEFYYFSQFSQFSQYLAMPLRLVVLPIFLGTTNFTIFRSFCNFCSFRNFRSFQAMAFRFCLTYLCGDYEIHYFSQFL